MRWEELSMSDRSNLMKAYLQNGVVRLSDMRDHYNKFVSGGPLRNEYDNPESPEEYATFPYKPTLRRVNSFDRGGAVDLPVRDSTQPTVRPIFAGNFQVQEQPEYAGPIVGEIRADERSKTQKFFDRVRTNYNTSSFGNSAVAEVLSATTPYGSVHESMRGNNDSALLSVVPFGATIKSGAKVAKSAYKVGRAASNKLPSQINQGKLRASDLKQQQDRLELFREYLNDPEVRKKKIPAFYEPRINRLEEDINNMQKVYNDGLNSYYDIEDAPYFLGYNTKIVNPPNPNWAGWYDPNDDLIRLAPSSIDKGRTTTWAHEYNHFLDHNIVSSQGYMDISPEILEYLKSLIDPYRYSSRKEYFINTQLGPLSKNFYKLSNTSLGKQFSKVVPKKLKDLSRKTYKRFYRNSAANINDFSYRTSPLEAREYMSEGAQTLWQLNKERGENYLILSENEPLLRENPGISALLDGIPKRNRKAFLKNFEEKGFSYGGYL